MRWVHRTLGVFVAFYVLMISVTGAALMFRHEILGLAYSRSGPLPDDLVGQAGRLAGKLEPGSFTSIKFPDEALAAFIVNMPGYRTALYDPVSLAPIEDRYGLNLGMDWLFELHHFLLAGEVGMWVAGAFGIAIAGLILIGLYLWWPWRRGWRLTQARAQRPTHSSRLAAHTTLAVLMAPALFLGSITGAAVIYTEQVQGAFIALFGSRDGTVPLPSRSGSLADLSRTVFPEAAPRLLVPPREPGGATVLRLRQPRERHPNGRTVLRYDSETRRAVAATSEPESGAGNRLYNLLYPLHTGDLGGLPLRLFYLLSAPLAFLSAWNGMRAWFRRRRRPAR